MEKVIKLKTVLPINCLMATYNVILQSHRNMSQLPNFAFSVPLAMFHRTIRDGEDTSVADNMVH